jgi:hypothetical protein
MSLHALAAASTAEFSAEEMVLRPPCAPIRPRLTPAPGLYGTAADGPNSAVSNRHHDAYDCHCYDCGDDTRLFNEQSGADRTLTPVQVPLFELGRLHFIGRYHLPAPPLSTLHLHPLPVVSSPPPSSCVAFQEFRAVSRSSANRGAAVAGR